MNEIRIDFEKKLENLTVLHDLYLDRMLRENDPLKQDTLLVVVDKYKEEMIAINEIIFKLTVNPKLLVYGSDTINQISNYKNN